MEREVSMKQRNYGAVGAALAGFFSIPMIMTLAFAIPYFTKNMYEIFFPPRVTALPIWVWIVLGVAVLVVVKVVTSGGRQEVVYLQ